MAADLVDLDLGERAVDLRVRRAVAAEVATVMGLVEPILLTLARCFVLDSQSDPPSYRYRYDALLDLDVER